MYCFLFAGESHLAPAPFRPVAKKPTTTDFTFAHCLYLIYQQVGRYIRRDAPISHERKFVVEIFTCSQVYLDLFWKKKKYIE